MTKPKLNNSWFELLSDEFNAHYFKQLKDFLVTERQKHTIYPPGSLIFSAFDQTPVDQVKTVILGQDPYHGPGQAHGLCFSVNEGVRFPPSLQNIFKELKSDIGMKTPQSGNLSKWANEGVLLLNATLTVRANNAGSHQNRGWELFTDAAIRKLSSERKNLVFLLWGRFAQKKEAIIDKNNGHLILKAAHPSPLSAYSGFFGCKHFSKTNAFLKSKGIEPIDWNLSAQ